MSWSNLAIAPVLSRPHHVVFVVLASRGLRRSLPLANLAWAGIFSIPLKTGAFNVG